MELAWHTAALYRIKRMPKLADLIGVAKRPQGQAWQEMLSIARMYTVLHGGTVVPTADKPE